MHFSHTTQEHGTTSKTRAYIGGGEKKKKRKILIIRSSTCSIFAKANYPSPDKTEIQWVIDESTSDLPTPPPLLPENLTSSNVEKGRGFRTHPTTADDNLNLVLTPQHLPCCSFPPEGRNGPAALLHHDSRGQRANNRMYRSANGQAGRKH